MKVRTLHILWSLLFLSGVANFCPAQNLVQNHSFESYSACPTGGAQMGLSSGWYFPTNGTSDYFNACVVPTTTVGVPANAFGYQWPVAGNAYGGFFIHNSPLNQAGNYKEYLQTALAHPLANKVYYFEMYVSLADNCGLASNKIGAVISVDSIFSSGNAHLTDTPQVITTTYIDDKNGWTRISGFIAAKGGERFLTIGSFMASDTSNLQAVQNGLTTSYWPYSAYYYIDDVSLIDSCNIVSNILVNDTNICGSTPFNVNATRYSATNYLWNTMDTSAEITISQPGKYWVKVNANYCWVVDTINVTHTNLNISLGVDTTLCTSSPLVLTPANSPSGAAFKWHDSSTASTFVAAQTGLYYVTVSKLGCTKRDSINISYAVPPNLLGRDTDVCGIAGSFPLNLSAQAAQANSYLWSNASTNASISVADTGYYWVNIEKGSCQLRDSIHIGNSSIPVLNLGTDSVLCAGEVLQLTSPANADSYRWYRSFNITNPSYTLASTQQSMNVYATGLYINEYRKSVCIRKDTVLLRFNTKPTVNIGNDVTACFGNTVNLTTSNINTAYKYLWQNGDTNTLQVANAPGLYWLQVDNGGCKVRDTMLLSYIPQLKVNVGNDTALCATTFKINPVTQNALAYKWQNNITDSSLTVSLPGGLFWLEISNGPCKARDTILLSFKPVPTVNLGIDSMLCFNQTITLKSPTAGASYLWHNNSTDSFLTTNTAGLYWLQATKNGCVSRDSITLGYKAQIPFNMGNDTSVCGLAGTILLNATLAGATAYKWSTNEVAPAILVYNSGNYRVDVTKNGCVVSDSVTVTFKPALSLNVGSDTTLCTNNTLLLNAKIDSATYLWDDLSTQKTRLVSTDGMYWVRVSKNGCVDADSLFISRQTAPVFDLGSDTSICDGSSITLSANVSNATFKWQDGSTQQTFFANKINLYKVTVTKGVCRVSDSVYITVLNNQTLNIGNDTAYCFNQPITLQTAVIADSYLWQDGSSQPNFTAIKPGMYWLEITKSVCVVRDSVLLTQQTIPTVNIGADKSLCKEITETLDAANPGQTYLWEDLSTTQTHTIKPPGLFFVKVTNAIGCYTIDSILLDTFTAPVVTLGADTFVCADMKLKLDAGTGFNLYTWQDGSTQQAFFATKAGLHFVRVTDANNCTATDSILLGSRPKPKINFPALINACEPDIILNPGNFISYLWHDGSTNPLYKVSEYGNYSVTVTDSNFCENSVTTLITNRCPGTVYVPNAFTPNYDNVNDVFMPSVLNIKAITFRIYDRWGNMLFETDQPNTGWNGKTGDEYAENAVFIYHITYIGMDDVSKSLKGNFTLLR